MILRHKLNPNIMNYYNKKMINYIYYRRKLINFSNKINKCSKTITKMFHIIRKKLT